MTVAAASLTGIFICNIFPIDTEGSREVTEVVCTL